MATSKKSKAKAKAAAAKAGSKVRAEKHDKKAVVAKGPAPDKLAPTRAKRAKSVDTEAASDVATLAEPERKSRGKGNPKGKSLVVVESPAKARTIKSVV